MEVLLYNIYAIGAVIVVAGITLVLILRQRSLHPDIKLPQGHWMAFGITFGTMAGIITGIVIGIIAENIPLGVSSSTALCAGIGMLIGNALEKQHKTELRQPTPVEGRYSTVLLAMGLILVGIGIVSVGTFVAHAI